MRHRLRSSLILMVSAFGCSRSEPAPESEVQHAVAVRCVLPTQANVDDVVNITGNIAPPPRLDAMISSPVAGRIARVYVEEGDEVAEGALLATVEDPSLPAGKVQASAEVARARANKLAADQDFVRQQRLVTTGIGAQRDLDEAKARSAAAEAELDAAEARAGLATQNNDRRELRAPHAGVVLQISRRVGESVDGTTATPVARVANLSTLELHAQLPAARLAVVRAGMAATIRVAALDRDIPGKVVRVAPALDPATLLGRLRVQLDAPPGIPIGSAASGAVVTGSHVGLLVPSSALRRSNVGSDEIVICDGSVARVRTVVVGPQHLGLVAIADGLRAGEQVVADHVLGLEEGQPIVPEQVKAR